MSEIENKNLYQDEETPVLKHYSEFDNVYIGLLPFFKLDKEHCNTNSSKKQSRSKKLGKKTRFLKILEIIQM